MFKEEVEEEEEEFGEGNCVLHLSSQYELSLLFNQSKHIKN